MLEPYIGYAGVTDNADVDLALSSQGPRQVFVTVKTSHPDILLDIQSTPLHADRDDIANLVNRINQNGNVSCLSYYAANDAQVLSDLDFLLSLDIAALRLDMLDADLQISTAKRFRAAKPSLVIIFTITLSIRIQLGIRQAVLNYDSALTVLNGIDEAYVVLDDEAGNLTTFDFVKAQVFLDSFVGLNRLTPGFKGGINSLSVAALTQKYPEASMEAELTLRLPDGSGLSPDKVAKYLYYGQNPTAPIGLIASPYWDTVSELGVAGFENFNNWSVSFFSGLAEIGAPGFENFNDWSLSYFGGLAEIGAAGFEPFTVWTEPFWASKVEVGPASTEPFSDWSITHFSGLAEIGAAGFEDFTFGWNQTFTGS